jgi:hypothetical protein
VPPQADDLYALPPRDFTAARNARVAQARDAGDKSGATALAALKRPTVGAWLVNVVALRRPESVARLVELGERLRAAQAELTGGPAAVRELTIRRREAVEAVMADVRELADAAGEPAPTPQQLAEAESTFNAALADADAASLVQSGRVLKALSYSGFGAAPAVRPAGSAGPRGGRADGDASPGSVTAGAAAPAPAAEPDELAGRRAAAADALAQARTALGAAIEVEQAATADVDALTRSLEELRERLAVAQSAGRAARVARQEAEREVATRERRLARLDRA